MSFDKLHVLESNNYLKFVEGVYDAHCHLEQNFLEAQEIVQKCKSVGMDGLITVCSRPSDLNNTIKISEYNQGFVHYTVGLHPLEAIKISEKEIADYMKQIRDLQHFSVQNVPIAIGEIGLDYVLIKDKENISKSKLVFTNFIKLAKSMKLPIVIHCREAYRDIIDILKSDGVKNVVFHYFNQPEYIKEIIDNGWSVSLPITLSKSKIKIICEFTDLSSAMLETDSPIELGKRKITPLNIGELVENISKTTSIPEKEVIKKTKETVKRFFEI